jgi:tRNA(Leu) C34 or U34 (ribose-2'-O)-methylase TrmL
MTKRGFAAIGLFNPKSEYNIGGVLRAATCYGAATVVHTGNRYKNASTDTTKAYRHIPFYRVEDLFDFIPHSCVPVAVDLIDGACNLVDYIHPQSAYYIFGPEDSTLGRRVTDKCRDVIYIPTNYCMNLAATVNVVLYDRMAKSAMESGVKYKGKK